jgi:hypothetical protein
MRMLGQLDELHLHHTSGLCQQLQHQSWPMLLPRRGHVVLRTSHRAVSPLLLQDASTAPAGAAATQGTGWLSASQQLLCRALAAQANGCYRMQQL